MTRRYRVIALLSLPCLVVVAAQGKQAPLNPGTGLVPAEQVGQSSTASRVSPRGAVVGKPYSGEQVTERVQTLADGTRITQTLERTMLYRDSEGRTRTEHIFTPPGSGEIAGPSLIQISDPVAGVRYTLNPKNHTAQRMSFSPGALGNGALVKTKSAPTSQAGVLGGVIGSVSRDGTASSVTTTSSTPASRPRPQVSHESLGTQNIDGVIAEGNRMTSIYPEGSVGNDRALTVITETWMSPELKIVVLRKTSDLRSGDSTMKLENLSQTEPDPSLFQVSADYR